MRRVFVALAGVAVLIGGSIALIAAPANNAAAEDLDLTVRPDATLSPGETATFTNNKPMTNPESAALSVYPADCRHNAIIKLGCKVYRIALNVDKNPLADNIIIFDATFDQLRLPSLAAVAAGLNPIPLNGLDVYIYDEEDHYLGQNAPGLTDAIFGPGDPDDHDPGGHTFASPERGSFDVKQKFYDIMVTATEGVNSGFTLHVTYSNEIFKLPGELLDQLGAPLSNIAPPPPGTFDQPPLAPDSGGATLVNPLPDASVLPDADIGSVGSGISEQFNTPLLTAIGRTRPISANAKPPSGAALIAGLLAFPLIAAGAGVVVMRRRRQSLVT